MDRDPTVHLEPNVSRCTAIAGCAKARECARRMATIPAHGGRIEDFSEAARVIGECTRYLPIRRGYQATMEKRAVKDWPGGA